MTEVGLLLRAYGEYSYDLLESNREGLIMRAGELLSVEVERREFGDFDSEKYEAYRDACVAFIDERIEAYNPIGVQFTFDRAEAKEAAMLEMQLNWFDSRGEFEELILAANDLVEMGITDETMEVLAMELAAECGVFPDKSIISTYEREPALNRLPDYVVARSIEDLVEQDSC